MAILSSATGLIGWGATYSYYRGRWEQRGQDLADQQMAAAVHDADDEGFDEVVYSEELIAAFHRQNVKYEKREYCFFCRECRMARSAYHDCRGTNNAPSKQSYYAWLGDAQHHLDVKELIGRVDQKSESSFTSNAAMTAYILKFYPELVPKNNNGTPASEHSIGTVFEERYRLDPKFRLNYLYRITNDPRGNELTNTIGNVPGLSHLSSSTINNRSNHATSSTSAH